MWEFLDRDDNFPELPGHSPYRLATVLVHSFSEIKASRIVDVGMTEETIRKLTIFQGSKDVSVERKIF